MSEVTPAPAAPTDGTTTSEFTITKFATILTVLATVVGVATDFFQSLSSAVPGSKWIGPTLTALGYQYARATVKAAAHAAAGQVGAATATAAAKNLGES